MQLLKETVLKDFYDLWPNKFSNKTNGVTPRRWLVVSNPELASLITEHIGANWITNLEGLRQLEGFIDDINFRTKWRAIKRQNKVRLAKAIADRTGVTVDPDSLFDIQVKRLHEYERQHLNVLHIISLYNQIKRNPNIDVVPRTFICGMSSQGHPNLCGCGALDPNGHNQCVPYGKIFFRPRNSRVLCRNLEGRTCSCGVGRTSAAGNWRLRQSMFWIC